MQLNWGAHTAAGHATIRWDSVKAIMAEWSNSGPEEDDGVNVRLCFSRHDKDGNGCIGTSELESVVKVSFFTKLLFHVPLLLPFLSCGWMDVYLYLPEICIDFLNNANLKTTRIIIISSHIYSAATTGSRRKHGRGKAG